MHGQPLAPRSHYDRSTLLVDPTNALGRSNYQFEKPAGTIKFNALLSIARNRMLSLAIIFLALAAGAASIWLTKPVYSARATIQIDQQPSSIVGPKSIAPDGGRTEIHRLLKAQVELLASRSTAQNVANKLNLANNPLFLREVGLEDEPADLKRSAKVAATLQDRLNVSAPRDTRIIVIRFDSRDPVAAARIANTFAETFVSDSLERRLDNHDYARRIFFGQLEVAKARLEQSERNLVNYARSVGLVVADLDAAGLASSELRSITAASLVDLNAAYSRAQANRMQAQQRWQRAISTPVTGNPISIVDRAQTPTFAAYPRPAMNMALAALVGALALGLDIARSRVDDKVHGSGDVERDFDAQLLGVVPLPNDSEELALATLDPLWPGSEAHHAVFVALDRVARTADQRVLLLTSSCPKEGKSIIASKLSANFAAAGKKVLVIDTDMRRGSLHRMLGLSNQLGLANLLAKNSSYELTNVTQYCADRGFSVVPRGHPETNPEELLVSRRFADLLDEAANLYDIVIMDGPPVLGLADAPRLSGMADATVFVLQADQTSREHAKLALRRLSEAGAGWIGLVISKYDPATEFAKSDAAYSDGYTSAENKEVLLELPPRAELAPAHRRGEPGQLFGSRLLVQHQEGLQHGR